MSFGIGLLFIAVAATATPKPPLHASAASKALLAAEAPARSVTTVPRVDLQRYAGLWYEIARIPAWFQSGCAWATTATYRLRDDGAIAVTNTCIRPNGQRDRARGLARVVDPTTNARLQVSFVSLLGWRPFWGDYWIIGLDPGYRWAVIGDPRRRYGWILARTPDLDAATREATLSILERNGYRRSRLVFAPQSAQASLPQQMAGDGAPMGTAPVLP